MKTHRCIIELLEGRQLLSASVDSTLVFQGNAVNTRGAIVQKLLMTVQPTGSGFSDEVIMTDNAGDVTSFSMSMDAAGQFSGTEGTLTVAGRMNGAHTLITGTWVTQNGTTREKGTLKLTEIPPPNAALPSTNTRTTITDFAGTDTNQSGKTSNVTLQVVDTNGVRTGEVMVHNSDDQLVPIPFKISSTGAIAFTFSTGDQTNIVQGKLSSNGQTITATWTSINSDGTAGFGSMVATAVSETTAAKA